MKRHILILLFGVILMSWFTPFAHALNFINPIHYLNQGNASAQLGQAAYSSPGPALGGTATNAGGGGSGGGGTTGGTSVLGANTGYTAPSTSSPTPTGQNTSGGSTDFINSQYLPQVTNLQNAYNNIFNPGGIYDSAVGQAAGNLQKAYGAQQSALDTQYAANQRQLPWQYAARGAGQSGFFDSALNDAQQNYKSSSDQIQAAQAKDIANLQQQEQGLSGQYKGYLNAFNDPAYQAMLAQAPSYIQSEAYNNILQDIGNLNYTQGANTPLSKALGEISGNPSYTDQGAQILQNQLQALINSGAPAGAQSQIAQALISGPGGAAGAAGQNPTYWNNYWQQLQGGQSPTAQLGVAG